MLIANDRHGASAQNIRWAHNQRQTKIACNDTGLLDGIGNAILWLFQAKTIQQALKPIAVFRKINRVDWRAKDRRSALGQTMR